MNMRLKSVFAIFGAAALCAGCVGTVAGNKQFGVPWVKDNFIGRYERPVDEVFEASKAVVKYMGTLVSEATLHETNTVKTVVGKVNQRNIYIRVEPVDPKVTAVTVQARTKGGGTDQDLVHEIEKQISLKLVK